MSNFNVREASKVLEVQIEWAVNEVILIFHLCLLEEGEGTKNSRIQNTNLEKLNSHVCPLLSPTFFLMKKSRIWAWPKAPTWAPSWAQIWLEMKKTFEFEFRFLFKTLALDFVAHWTTFDLENNSARVVATQARIIFLFFFFYNSIIELLSTLKVVWS